MKPDRGPEALLIIGVVYFVLAILVSIALAYHG